MLQLDGRLLTPLAEGIGFQRKKWPEGRFVRPVGHIIEVPRRGGPPGLGSSATWRRRACRQRALLCVGRVTCGKCACVGLRTVDASTQTKDGQHGKAELEDLVPLPVKVVLDDVFVAMN